MFNGFFVCLFVFVFQMQDIPYVAHINALQWRDMNVMGC